MSKDKPKLTYKKTVWTEPKEPELLTSRFLDCLSLGRDCSVCSDDCPHALAKGKNDEYKSSM